MNSFIYDPIISLFDKKAIEKKNEFNCYKNFDTFQVKYLNVHAFVHFYALNKLIKTPKFSLSKHELFLNSKIKLNVIIRCFFDIP